MNNIDKFITENIYLDLCQKDITDEELEFNSNYLYLSVIPDFIENNEKKFINHKSNEYIKYIQTCMDDFYYNRKSFILKPSILILIKLTTLFEKEFDYFNLDFIFTKIVKYISYNKSNSLFINSTNLLGTDKITEYNYVLQSCIIQFYESLDYLEGFYNFCDKIFYIKKSNYNLLSSELDFIDKNYNLDSQQYNNLKFNLFLGVLSQLALVDKDNRFEPLEFFNPVNPPSPNSIRFVIFLAWYIYQKVAKKSLQYDNLFDGVNMDININKFYFMFFIVDDDIFEKIFNIIDSKRTDNLVMKNKYDINEIFDSENNFITNKLDYEIQPTFDKDIIKTNIESEFGLATKNNLIMAYGGGNIKIPILPFYKIAYYQHYLRKYLD